MTRTSWWWTPTAATASPWRRAATCRCATTRASWWATSSSGSSSPREDLSRLLDRILRRGALLSERRPDAALVVARDRPRRTGAGRSLSRRPQARRGGHGTGVPRRAREDGAQERDQSDEPVHGARTRRRRALQSGGR